MHIESQKNGKFNSQAIKNIKTNAVMTITYNMNGFLHGLLI